MNTERTARFAERLSRTNAHELTVPQSVGIKPMPRGTRTAELIGREEKAETTLVIRLLVGINDHRRR